MSSDNDEDGFIPFFSQSDNEEEEVEEKEEERQGPLMINELPVPWLDAQNPQYQHNLERRAPPFVRLHNEILTFCRFITPTPTEMRVREKVVLEVNDLAKSVWPTCTVHLFGSQFTNILTPTSDIDIAILDVPIPEGQTLVDLLVLFANKIHEKINVLYLEAVTGARVPIIKFDHADSGLAVDICINHDSGLRTGQLMKRMARDFPPLLPLTLTLKTFLAQRRLNDTYSGGLGSFLLTSMIVSFLQMKQNAAQHVGMKPSWNLGTLLVEFFHYYGVQFNYFQAGFAIHEGGKLFPKQEWYKQNNSTGGNTPGSASKGNMGRPGLLCAVNPDAPDMDMGKNSYMMTKIRRAFEHGYQLLTVAVNDPHQHSFLNYIIRADDPYLMSRIPLKR